MPPSDDPRPAPSPTPAEGAFPFTVVMPSYNRPEVAVAALERLAGPETAGLEVIVVDDGSTDGTVAAVEAVAARSRGAVIRVIRQANAGPGAARNRGAAAAATPWVVFHDSDDLWMPWTAGVLRDLLAGPEAAAASILLLSTRSFHDPAELEGLPQAPLEIRRHATMLDFRLADRLPMIASCNLAFRREAYLALGGFVTDVRHGEDTDLLYRASLVGEAWAIAAPVMMGYRAAQAGTDNLTNSGDAVRNRRTLYLLERNRQGLYPGPRRKVAEALGRTVAYTVRGYFAKGYVGPAYRVYAQGFATLFAARQWNALLRLPLTPLLSLVKPEVYRFRWRRQAAPPS